MAGVVKTFFMIGVLLMASGGYFLLAIKKPGMYPPKYILKRRGSSLILAGSGFFLLGLIIHSFR